MQQAVFAILVVMGLASTAGATLSCQSPADANDFQLTIKAGQANIDNNNVVQLWGVSVKAVGSDHSSESGYGTLVANDSDYQPRKYKGFYRFSLDQLVDADTLRAFEPIQECALQFLLPEDFDTKTSFQAHVILNCDQNGFARNLDCVWFK